MPADVRVMQLRHLARELTSITELAIAAQAPTGLVERLACATGLLLALKELPLETDPLRLWAHDAVARAEQALLDWRRWETERRATA